MNINAYVKKLATLIDADINHYIKEKGKAPSSYIKTKFRRAAVMRMAPIYMEETEALRDYLYLWEGKGFGAKRIVAPPEHKRGEEIFNLLKGRLSAMGRYRKGGSDAFRVPNKKGRDIIMEVSPTTVAPLLPTPAKERYMALVNEGLVVPNDGTVAILLGVGAETVAEWRAEMTHLEWTENKSIYSGLWPTIKPKPVVSKDALIRMVRELDEADVEALVDLLRQQA